jgi:NADH:ubiquinone oxidoreductase subunit 6 (subunit J)
VGETGAFPGAAVSSVRAIGGSLFTDYAFPFEVTSILILVAMVGAVVLAKSDRKDVRAGGGAGSPPEA